MHVILALHGAPGSQNGLDNSGQRTNNPVWGSTNSSVQRTLDIIRFIADNIGGMVDVIELLNEPAAGWIQTVDNALSDYWQQGYQIVREAAGNETIVMIGDGFLGVDVCGSRPQCCAKLTQSQSWENFLVAPEATGVIMDYVSSASSYVPNYACLSTEWHGTKLISSCTASMNTKYSITTKLISLSNNN